MKEIFIKEVDRLKFLSVKHQNIRAIMNYIDDERTEISVKIDYLAGGSENDITHFLSELRLSGVNFN